MRPAATAGPLHAASSKSVPCCSAAPRLLVVGAGLGAVAQQRLHHSRVAVPVQAGRQMKTYLLHQRRRQLAAGPAQLLRPCKQHRAHGTQSQERTWQPGAAACRLLHRRPRPRPLSAAGARAAAGDILCCGTSRAAKGAACNRHPCCPAARGLCLAMLHNCTQCTCSRKVATSACPPSAARCRGVRPSARAGAEHRRGMRRGARAEPANKAWAQGGTASVQVPLPQRPCKSTHSCLQRPSLPGHPPAASAPTRRLGIHLSSAAPQVARHRQAAVGGGKVQRRAALLILAIQRSPHLQQSLHLGVKGGAAGMSRQRCQSPAGCRHVAYDPRPPQPHIRKVAAGGGNEQQAVVLLLLAELLGAVARGGQLGVGEATGREA